eukprot:gene10420-10578_t
MASSILLPNDDLFQGYGTDDLEGLSKAPPRSGSYNHGTTSSSLKLPISDSGDGLALARPLDAQEAQQPHHRHSASLFFHNCDCKLAYDTLAAVAAAGEQQFPLPTSSSPAFWQPSSPTPLAPATWRLLDLAEVKRLYKNAQKAGSLLKQHQKISQQLAADEQQVQQQQEAARQRAPWAFAGRGVQHGVSSSSSRAADLAPHTPIRPAVATRLDDFLMASELLKRLGDTPKDLLEDSFAMISRQRQGGPVTCAATFNVFGQDHARLQGLVTPAWRSHQGHATQLLKQLEGMLTDAHCKQLVVILEPKEGEVGGPDVAHWLQRRMGYKEASSEQQMLWRRELPEYHKSLVAGCTLL